MSDAWILAGVRTPIGKFLGAFAGVPAPELGAVTLRELLQRTRLDAAQIDEVILGNVISAGLGQAPARQAALKAGLRPTVAALTINKVCGSGLKAVMLAAQAVRLGDAEVVLAGGMENMSRAPHLATDLRQGVKMGNLQLTDAMVHDGLWCAFGECHMGEHAEFTAESHGLTRADLDRFSLESQQKAARAAAEGAFRDEIVPVPIRQRREDVLFDADEGPRPETTAESLAKLKAAFRDQGQVTAGNSSTLSDGAAAVVVASRAIAEKVTTPWRARIVASHTSGSEPRDLFTAPVEAVRGVLRKAGLKTCDIDLYEINEAFASQMLACLRQLELDPAKVNINGGAIALGHPIGASGARALVTLLWALHHRDLRRGLVSLCLGGGNAVAMIVEREMA